jgi:LPXTG-site transpeptidase (sortase) family protein
VTQAEIIAGGNLSNTVTADSNESIQATASLNISINVLPAVTVTKIADPTLIPETGGSVTFTFVVRNSGTVPVSISSLYDAWFGPLPGDSDCNLGTSLASGASCTFDYSTTLSGTTGTTYTNTFTAGVTDIEGNNASDTDTADVTFTDVLPAVTVTKTADPTEVEETGGSVTFTYVVSNSGTVPATISALSDDKFPTLAGDADCEVGTALAAGASCTFDYSPTLSGATGTTHTNTFTAVVADADGNNASNSDTAGVTFTDVLPAVTVIKTADPVSVPETGGSVTFTFEVRNSGTVPVTVSTISDDKFGVLAGDADCKVGTVLAAGASCTFDYSTTLSGASGTTHTNEFSAVVTDADGNDASSTDTADVTFSDVLPGVTVTKVADPISVPETGGSVTFTYVVSNSGTIPVTISTLSDDKFGVLAGDADCKVGTTLAAGVSCTFDFSTTLSGAAGTSHTNEFTAVVTDADGKDATNTDTANVTFADVIPSISVTKTADPTSIPETSESVTFTFVVNNDGDVPVTITSLSDDKFGVLGGDADCSVGTTLAAGASCTFDYSTTLSGTAGTTHTNEFTAHAEDADGNDAASSDTADVTFTDVYPSVVVTKSVDPASLPETGGNVTYTFVVDNNSDVPVTITTLSDDKLGTLAGDADCQVGTVLGAGDNCSFDYLTSLSGTSGTTHTNEFTAIVTDADGNTATNTDTAGVIFTDVLPAVSVTKTADPTTLPETGGNVTFTFEVTNEGDVPVTISSLVDDKFGTLSGDADCSVGTALDPAASCTFTYNTDLSGTAGTTHTNEFTAQVEDADGQAASASDTAVVSFTDVLPSVNVTKSADPVSVPGTGGDVTYTFTVENTSDIPVTIMSLADDKFGVLTGDGDCGVGTTLDAGASCSFEYIATLSGDAGTKHTNTFTAHVQDVDGNDANANATAEVSFTDTGTAMIGLAKGLISKELVSVGTYDVTYNFVVTNYGTKDLSAIQVVDDLQATFPVPTLFTVQSVSSDDFHVNDGYNGVTDLNLLDGSDTLAAGASGEIALVVRVVPADSGPFNNSASASSVVSPDVTVSDVSQDGSDPDGPVDEHDGDPTNNSDPTPVSFGGNLFDPPMGIKTVDGTGKPVLVWTMVWINNANKFAVDAVVHDPIPEGSSFTPSLTASGYDLPAVYPIGSTNFGVSCTAGTSTTTTTTLCYYEGPTAENPRGQIIWAGTVDADFGVSDPDLAANAIRITFTLTANAGVTRVSNTATIDSDLNGNGTTTDGGESKVARASEVWGGGGGDPTQEPTAAKSATDGLPIPLTGFAPDVITPLSANPVDLKYADLGDLWLEIPSLNVSTPIIGVPQSSDGWNVTWLGNQAGWLNGTAYPTWAGNSVITAHVYNADGKPGPFLNIASLKYGDQIIIHAWGQQYIYEVRETKEVLPDNTSVISKHEDLPWLTLVTCRGYDVQSGTYRYRYIVRAVQVKIK